MVLDFVQNIITVYCWNGDLSLVRGNHMIMKYAH